jgi:hypothetical protein
MTIARDQEVEPAGIGEARSIRPAATAFFLVGAVALG